MYSQERKGISGGWKVTLQGNVNHAELQSLVRKAGAEPGLVRTLLHPCLLEEKETLALLHTSSCSASAYLWPRVLRKVRPSFSLSSSSCKGTRFVASQQCPHLPTPWRESCRLGPRGFAAAATSSLRPCTGHHSSVWGKAGACSSFSIDLVVFCLWGFVCIGAGGKGRTPDSRLKSEFHLSCIFFSKIQHWAFTWKKEGLCRHPEPKHLWRTVTVAWLKGDLILP